MKVSNVQLVTISGDAVSGYIYEFSSASWVGLGAERGSRRFGPASLLELKTSHVKVKDVEIAETELPPKSLEEVDGQFLYRDEWTILPDSLFIIVLPTRWVAKRFFTSFDGMPIRLMPGVDADGSLFYFATFPNADFGVLRVEVELRQDDADYIKARAQLGPTPVSSADLMRKTALGAFLRSLGGKLADPQTWISSIEFIRNLRTG